ncbi:MAG: hypothetical protein K2P84_12330 [Undibacterium sp.]|nr:hypothetical protein [Undibacterium sp.]
MLPSYQMFSESVGTVFRVSADEGEEDDLVLKSISEAKLRLIDGVESASFYMLFEGAGDRCLPQRTLLFTHPQLGQFAMFIVPNGPDRVTQRMRYEVIFN